MNNKPLLENRQHTVKEMAINGFVAYCEGQKYALNKTFSIEVFEQYYTIYNTFKWLDTSSKEFLDNLTVTKKKEIKNYFKSLLFRS